MNVPNLKILGDATATTLFDGSSKNGQNATCGNGCEVMFNVTADGVTFRNMTIDLGDSGEYDCRWVLERCAESDTVLYSRIAAEPGEDWRSYVERLARLVTETGAEDFTRLVELDDDREGALARGLRPGIVARLSQPTAASARRPLVPVLDRPMRERAYTGRFSWKGHQSRPPFHEM